MGDAAAGYAQPSVHGLGSNNRLSAEAGRQAPLGLARDCGSRGGGVGSRWLIRCHISSTPAVGRPALHETSGDLTGARRPTSVLFLSRGTVVNPNRPCWALDAARGKLLRRLSGADGVSRRRLMCPSVPPDVRSHRLSDRSQDWVSDRVGRLVPIHRGDARSRSGIPHSSRRRGRSCGMPPS